MAHFPEVKRKINDEGSGSDNPLAFKDCEAKTSGRQELLENALNQYIIGS